MAPIMETGDGGEYDPANAYPSGLPEVFRWEAGAPTAAPAPAESPLVLYYLPVRARAENIRMMLAYAGVAYEDRVIPFAEWKAEGGLKWQMPFGQLPAVQLPGDGGRWPACSAPLRTLPAGRPQQAKGCCGQVHRAVGGVQPGGGDALRALPEQHGRGRLPRLAVRSRPGTRDHQPDRQRLHGRGRHPA